MMIPFYARDGAATKALAVTTTSSRVQMLDNGSSTARYSVKVSNTGTVNVFLTAGGSTVVSVLPVAGGASGGQCVQAGATEVLTFDGPYIAALTDTGTATIYLVEGYAKSF